MDRQIKNIIIPYLRKKGVDSFTITEHAMSGRNKIFLLKDKNSNTEFFLKIHLHTNSEIWFFKNYINYPYKAELLIMDDKLNFNLLKNYSNGQTLFEEVDKRKIIHLLSSTALHLSQLHNMPMINFDNRKAKVFLPKIDPIEIEVWQSASPALQKLIRLLQKQGIISIINSKIDKQKPITCLIHGDLKLDNIMMNDGSIIILDWELCGMGELSWDLGAIIGSMILIWIDDLNIEDVHNRLLWEKNTEIEFDFIKTNINNFLRNYLELSNNFIKHSLSLDFIVPHICMWIIMRTWAEATNINSLTRNQLARLLFIEGFFKNPSYLINPKVFKNHA